MYYQSRSIILKTSDLRETDKIVTVFSEKEGKISAVARGVKKPKSSLRACVQPFCHSLLFLNRGRELDLITQAKLIDFYGNSREDLPRMLYAVYMMEILDKSLMERMPQRNLYYTTLEILEHMNDKGFNPLIIRFFELKLLISQGYKPMLKQCIYCGNKQAVGFVLSEGGVVCADCTRHYDSIYRLSGETLALLRLFLASNVTTLSRVKASENALQQMESFLEVYLEYYLERKFNMNKTIKMLKRKMML